MHDDVNTYLILKYNNRLLVIDDAYTHYMHIVRTLYAHYTHIMRIIFIRICITLMALKIYDLQYIVFILRRIMI